MNYYGKQSLSFFMLQTIVNCMYSLNGEYLPLKIGQCLNIIIFALNIQKLHVIQCDHGCRLAQFQILLKFIINVTTHTHTKVSISTDQRLIDSNLYG